MENKLSNFIQSNSPDGGFLQSEYWRKFQESAGRETYNISESDDSGELFSYANIITHKLSVVGKYFYVPRGPIVSDQRSMNNEQYFNNKFRLFLVSLFDLARKNNAGWIRTEPNSEEELKLIQKYLSGKYKIK